MLAAEMYEIMDFPHDGRGRVSELARAIVRTGRPLELKRVPAESPVVAALEAAYRGRGVVQRKAVGGSPWIPLDECWAEPEMRLEAGRRSDLRRARRQGRKDGSRGGAVSSRPRSADLPRLLDEAFEVEAAGWKGAHGTALATDPVRGAFFRRYTEQACAKGILRMCMLRIGGKPAAAQIAIESGSRFDLLRAGYDEQFSRCSPGMLLTVESIRYAAQRGLALLRIQRRRRTMDQSLDAARTRLLFPARLSFQPARRMGAGADGRRAALRKLRAKTVDPQRCRHDRLPMAAAAAEGRPELRGGSGTARRSAAGANICRRAAVSGIHALLLGCAGRSPRHVADMYLAAVHAIETARLDSYVSVKAPSLVFDPALVGEITLAAARSRHPGAFRFARTRKPSIACSS